MEATSSRTGAYIKSQLQRFRRGNTTIRKTAVNPIQTVLEKAGIPITQEVIDQLPPFSHVQKMYGEEPVIIGLDRCEAFQRLVNPVDRLIGGAG